MADDNAALLVFVLTIIIDLCHTYFTAWTTLSGKNPLKHALIAFLLANAFCPILFICMAVHETGFHLSAEYIFALPSCLSGDVGKVLWQAFVRSFISIVPVVLFIKFGAKKACHCHDSLDHVGGIGDGEMECYPCLEWRARQVENIAIRVERLENVVQLLEKAFQLLEKAFQLLEKVLRRLEEILKKIE